jgi:hypothetical protein
VIDRGDPTPVIGLNFAPGATIIDITTSDDPNGNDYGQTCALSDDGEARCWGIGDYGRLGNGEAAYYATPQHVAAFAPDDELFGDRFDP